MNETLNTNLELKETENKVINAQGIMKELENMYPAVKEASDMFTRANEIQFEADCIKIFSAKAIMIGLLFYALPGAIMMTVNRKRKEKRQNLYNEAFALRQKAEQISLKISSPIPEKYRFEAAIEYAYELCQTGRANSLPELYDKLDEQIHRWQMLSQNEELIRNQQETNSRLVRVESEAKSAAFNSALSTIASIASNMY